METLCGVNKISNQGSGIAATLLCVMVVANDVTKLATKEGFRPANSARKDPAPLDHVSGHFSLFE